MLPPYPAAVVVAGSAWHSRFARDGRVLLNRPTLYIGRMESNDVILGDQLASRHHAVIRAVAGGYEIEDLGSANGTYVQGQRVVGRMPLTPGQVIRIGGTELMLQTFTAAFAAPVLAQGVPAQAVPGPERAFPPDRGAPTAAMLAARWPTAGAEALPGAEHPSHAANQQTFVATESGAPTRSEPGVSLWLRLQMRKRYWRVFLIGLAAYLIAAYVLKTSAILNLVPLVMLLASALVPVTFVIFCWEQNAFADMPAGVVGLTFLSGAVLGLTLAGILEPFLLPPSALGGISPLAAVVVSIIEETVKVIAVIWFLRNRKLRSELDGLILGAAAGMGFAALETAGYGFQAFLVGYTAAFANNAGNLAVATGISAMNSELLARMALAVFGHGVWTAIICATIWRERGAALFRLTPGVALAFGIAVALHALWDGGPATLWWYVPVGVLGILVLRFFILEALARAKLGPLAPPPPPLWDALLYYATHLLSQRAILPAASPASTSLRPSVPPGMPSSESGAAQMRASRPVAVAPLQQQMRPWPAPRACLRCGAALPYGASNCPSCGMPAPPVP